MILITKLNTLVLRIKLIASTNKMLINLIVHVHLGVTLLPMSAVSEEGVMTVKTEACDQLLAQRVEVKMKSKKAKDVMNRLHVAIPTLRDQKERPPCIPQVLFV